MSMIDPDTPASTWHCEAENTGGLLRPALSGGTRTLRKVDLADALSDRAGLRRPDARDVVDAFFDVIGEALESGDSVKLQGFGNFQIRDKRQRPGRNPKTREAAPIPARRVVKFRPGPKLNSLVDAGPVQIPDQFQVASLLFHGMCRSVFACPVTETEAQSRERSRPVLAYR